MQTVKKGVHLLLLDQTRILQFQEEIAVTEHLIQFQCKAFCFLIFPI